MLTQLNTQLRADRAIDPRGEHGIRPVYSNASFRRRFPSVRRFWTQAHPSDRVLLIDLVPVVAFASNDAT